MYIVGLEPAEAFFKMCDSCPGVLFARARCHTPKVIKSFSPLFCFFDGRPLHGIRGRNFWIFERRCAVMIKSAVTVIYYYSSCLWFILVPAQYYCNSVILYKFFNLAPNIFVGKRNKSMFDHRFFMQIVEMRKIRLLGAKCCCDIISFCPPNKLTCRFSHALQKFVPG